ncbi:LacI family DNA-binding transcriptional regulator [Ferrimonas balearica]|uniref:LacI family DNA-binding transcriptional regulator n=1 Tax=Ferrimonas balearica TaxID=44012 RepID=UPI001C991535|nr:LacI family DNA-binding transcriptional regulator [Ferrimonas balearica]MBY5993979.1 LacI family transcriptional regulator [Ferrimonas balearica]
MATIYDVSVMAGVSLATVSRVVNNNAKVSEKTRRKVLEAMEKLDYRPNAIARSLASNRSDSVGVLVSQLEGPYYGTMMAKIEGALREAGKHVIIAAGHGNEAEEREGVEFLLNRGCDALILDVESVSDDYLVELCRGDTPIVLINRYVDGIADRCIFLDNELGGYLATRHVLEQGHQQVAYISGPLYKLDVRQRLAGHKRALAERGLAFDEALFFEGDFQEDSGRAGVNGFFEQGRPFTALVCANDGMASGAIAAAMERGLSVPSDLSVMGYDNVRFPQYTTPKLSTVSNPIAQMGQMAALWVLKHVYQKGEVTVVGEFVPELVVRDSVGKI